MPSDTLTVEALRASLSSLSAARRALLAKDYATAEASLEAFWTPLGDDYQDWDAVDEVARVESALSDLQSESGTGPSLVNLREDMEEDGHGDVPIYFYLHYLLEEAEMDCQLALMERAAKAKAAGI